MYSRPWSLVALVLLFLTACSSPSGLQSPDASKKLITQQVLEHLIPAEADIYVVAIDPTKDPEQLANELGLSLVRVLDEYTIVVSGVLDENILLNDTDVFHFEQNQKITLAFGEEVTMGFFEGAGFKVSDLDSSEIMSQRDLETIHAEWTGAGTRIAVIDTGADAEHPWLAGRVVPSDHCDDLDWLEDANGLDDDEDGEIDEAYGHGTMVAGIIAQVAPDAQMISIAALNSDGVGSLADILTAMDAVLADGVDVLNLSLSLSQYSSLFDERLQRLAAAGIVIVAAAGNQGIATAFPANSPLAIGVAALDGGIHLASFSNSGPDCELAANGVGILSSYPDDHLGWGDGTSFAAPIVAGAIALLHSAGLDEQELLNVADPMVPLQHGRVDLVACFEASRTSSSPVYFNASR